MAKEKPQPAPAAAPETPSTQPESPEDKFMNALQEGISEGGLDAIPENAPLPPLSMRQFASMMLMVIRESRKPPIDPIKEKQKARAREQLRVAQEEFWKNKQAREDNCSHLRRNGTCCIAWATQSDGKVRGVCQHCDSVFEPGHKRYNELRRIPTGSVDDVNVIHA